MVEHGPGSRGKACRLRAVPQPVCVCREQPTGDGGPGWGITTTALSSASLNLAGTSLQGGGLAQMWKSGVAGLFTGGFTATGGVIGLADEGLLGKLAYQGIGSASRSIGQNWASGNSLFSRVQVGIGPDRKSTRLNSSHYS